MSSLTIGVANTRCLHDAARSEADRRKAQVLAELFHHIAHSDRAGRQRLFCPDADVVVVGLDRSKVGGVPPGASVSETLFPGGFRIDITRSAFSERTAFVEFSIRGLTVHSGVLYSSPATACVDFAESGLIDRYAEFTDVEALYRVAPGHPDLPTGAST